MQVTIWLIYGTIFGFGMLLWSDYKARNLNDTDNPEIYKPRQNRVFTVLLDYEKAFEICLEAIESLNPARIKLANLNDGVIKFRTRMNWHTFGHDVTVNLKKLNNNLTEIEISTVPIPSTALISAGYSYQCVEDFCRIIKEKDAATNQKVLADSTEILEEVYVKPFLQEKIKIKRQ